MANHHTQPHRLKPPMTIIVIARAKPFPGEQSKVHNFAVDPDEQSVAVWDHVAGHYTRCHSLSETAEARILRLANQETHATPSD